MTTRPTQDGRYRVITAVLFSLYLLVGVSVFRDYGISADEISQRRLGSQSWNYVLAGDFSSSLSLRNADHGPAFQMFLTAAENLMRLHDPRSIFLMRHLMNFLVFFAGVWFFYLLCRRHFGNYEIALLGTLFLILSPRIFADSFYNAKDIPFMSLYIVSMYTLVRLSDEKTFPAAAVHALSCALLIDVRITGIVMPAITFFSFATGLAGPADGRRAPSHAEKLVAVYVAVLVPSVILFWPYLWHDPLGHFLDAFRSMSHFEWNGSVLYLGHRVKGSDLPWHYIPVWLVITTPLLYTFTFFAGLWVFIAGLIRTPRAYLFGDRSRRREVIFFLCLVLPLAAVIALGSVLYNGWRHMFFIYPAFLLFSLGGLSSLFSVARKKFESGHPSSLRASAVIIVLSVLAVSYSMARDHPYQNVYFNALMNSDGEYLRSHFELDYWGLSYRQALEYILSHDDDAAIRISAASTSAVKNMLILPEAERERLRYVDDPSKAEYFLTHRPNVRNILPGSREFYSVRVGGSTIMTVYKLR